MCTITLEYNQDNALARRKLAALLATGLFRQKDVNQNSTVSEDVKSQRRDTESFLAHSKQSMSYVISRYL